jgi:prephenate dehydratase
MESYPKAAAELVNRYCEIAERAPDQAVSFQGAPGAYSHQAVREVAPDAAPLPCFSFEDAFEALVEGRVGRAVIPIENSLAGRVADIHFLLPESNLHIIGEHFVRVRHCLLAQPGVVREDLRQVTSHPQALSQCRLSLRNWGLRPIPYADTAGAAALIAGNEDPSVGAIASKLAAELYGLDVLAEGIEDVDHNTTRFVVLARSPVDPASLSGPVMTTVVFEVKSVPAALFKALGGFATNGVNLTKLESYMRGGSFQAAEFYVDLEGSVLDENVQRALEELRFHSKWLRVIGTYPQARSRKD